jgi:transcription termination/antitermination protein NusG
MPEQGIMMPHFSDEAISGLSWYAVHVRSRHEFIVRDALLKCGIDTFMPTYRKLRKWKDRNKIIEFPLFPGYVFVGLPGTETEKNSVLKTRGVVRFIGRTAGEAEVVPFEQIYSLMRIVESGEDIDPYPGLTEGKRVRLKSGPLKAVEGVLVSRKDTYHLVVSIDILSRGVSVQVDASNVEVI